MIPAFFLQYAAGCYIAVGFSATPQCGWRYFRLIAVVSFALALFGAIFLLRDPQLAAPNQVPVFAALGFTLLSGCAWLFVNAAQQERIGTLQRGLAWSAGFSSLFASILLLVDKPVIVGDAETSVVISTLIRTLLFTLTSTTLGALLLGSVTTAMLLGHRYLTDTDMSIDPLRRMTKSYIGVLAARIVWVGLASIPLFSSTFRPAGGELFFWLALTVRVGVGLIVTAIFAWMAWDCVRRRATQSATAMYYLSMFLVFLGELSSQYLRRTEGLAL